MNVPLFNIRVSPFPIYTDTIDHLRVPCSAAEGADHRVFNRGSLPHLLIQTLNSGFFITMTRKFSLFLL